MSINLLIQKPASIHSQSIMSWKLNSCEYLIDVAHDNLERVPFSKLSLGLHFMSSILEVVSYPYVAHFHLLVYIK